MRKYKLKYKVPIISEYYDAKSEQSYQILNQTHKNMYNNN